MRDVTPGRDPKRPNIVRVEVGERVHLVQLEVSDGHREGLVGVLFQHLIDAPERDDAYARFRRTFPEIPLVRVMGEGPGVFTAVTDEPRASVSPFAVAAAVAMVKCSYGWDESPVFTVTLDHVSFALSVTCDADRVFVITEVAA